MDHCYDSNAPFPETINNTVVAHNQLTDHFVIKLWNFSAQLGMVLEPFYGRDNPSCRCGRVGWRVMSNELDNGSQVA